MKQYSLNLITITPDQIESRVGLRVGDRVFLTLTLPDHYAGCHNLDPDHDPTGILGSSGHI